MSPVSRGRKKDNRRNGYAPERAEAPASPEEQIGAEHPAVREMLDNVVATLDDFERVDDPVDGEYLAASMLAVGYGTGPEAAEMFARLFIVEAEEFGGAGALAFLRCVAALSPEPTRTLATEAAERLAAQGVSAPAWVAELGEPTTAGEYFRWSEGDGVGAVLYGSFHRAGRTDGFLLFVDDEDCGSANDLAPFVSAEALAEARRMTNEEEPVPEAPIPADEFRWQVEAALDVRESHDREVIEQGLEPSQPEDDIPYEVTDVVLRARLRALPMPAKPLPAHVHPV
ncbi:hypothetical protein NDR87_19520 [Nocardia sp. CDC159]|uniref:Uncharacterized protein n=1 Tax=Nocardia pulmonis TaxID=2951408 RepID=A0A9X2E8J4_9NOCA|nr:MULTISPECIES: hypothetical protein [Nocardia]MCM6776117.1 hypothetical protein [Nocardia pulmonis]MCM6788556.1 hypothetical protein [Nocardia sp. CDC159]